MARIRFTKREKQMVEQADGLSQMSASLRAQAMDSALRRRNAAKDRKTESQLSQ